MTRPVKITLISISSAVVLFAITAIIFNAMQADVDEAAIKKDADEKASDLIDNLDSSFDDESDSSMNVNDTILSQPQPQP